MMPGLAAAPGRETVSAGRSWPRHRSVLVVIVAVQAVAIPGCGGPPALPQGKRSQVLTATTADERVAALVQVAHRLDREPDTRVDDRTVLRLASTVAENLPQLDEALARDQSFHGASPRAIVRLLGGLARMMAARTIIYRAMLRDELRQIDTAVRTFAQPRPRVADPKFHLRHQVEALALAHGIMVTALSQHGSDHAGSEEQVPLVDVARCQAQPDRTCSVLPSYPVLVDCVVLAIYAHTPAERLPHTMATRPQLTTDPRVDKLSAWWDTPGPLLGDDAIRDVYTDADNGWYDGKDRARDLAGRSS